MSLYKVGTVSVTNGSSIVTGSGTAFLANVAVADAFLVSGDAVYYTVASVQSATQLTLSANYGGTTGSGKSYQVSRDWTQFLKLAEIQPGDTEWPYLMVQSLTRKLDTIIATDHQSDGKHKIMQFDNPNSRVTIGKTTVAPIRTLHVAGGATGYGETVLAIQTPTLNHYLNACDDNGNNGDTSQITLRGLVSAGAATASLAAITLDTVILNLTGTFNTGIVPMARMMRAQVIGSGVTDNLELNLGTVYTGDRIFVSGTTNQNAALGRIYWIKTAGTSTGSFSGVAGSQEGVIGGSGAYGSISGIYSVTANGTLTLTLGKTVTGLSLYGHAIVLNNS